MFCINMKGGRLIMEVLVTPQTSAVGLAIFNCCDGVNIGK